jgi:acyl-CoA synthetase (AMP-forming)/AMP-acid ligase II
MLGLMQDWPLLIHRIIDHAATFHGDRKVITRSVEGPIVETDYKTIRARALKVAQRLDQDGIKLGDRVATLAWNTSRPGTAFSVSARSITRSIRGCFPSRSSGSSTTPATA